MEQIFKFATPGEELFARFLMSQNLEYEYEALIGDRKPDFLVHHPERTFVAEIYEPLNQIPSPGKNFDAYKVVRGAFQGRKRRQRIAANEHGLPFLLVIANSGSPIHIPPEIVAGAMFGDIRPNKGVRDCINIFGFEPTFSGRECLRPEKNRSMSAIATLSTLKPTEMALDAEFEMRLKNLTSNGSGQDEHTITLATLHDLQEMIVAELKVKGKYNPDVIEPVLTILHNPFARHPIGIDILDGNFVSQWNRINSQYGSVRVGSGLPDLRSLTISGLKPA